MNVVVFAEDDAPLRLIEGLPVSRGGAEKQLAAVATRLAGAGHEVVVLHGDAADPQESQQQSEWLARPGSVRGRSVPLGWRPASIWAFLAALLELRPGVVYARLPHDFLLFACLYARLTRRTRFVYAIADDAVCDPWRAFEHRRWFHGLFFALTLRLADVVLVQHEGQRQLLARRRQREIRLLPNVVDPIAPAARPVDAVDHDVVWAAHFRRMKRLDLLLDLAEALPGLRFGLIGDFPPVGGDERRPELERRIAALPNVSRLGLLAGSDARAVIARSRLLVNTSEHEGFPNTFLEAWSQGVPVVSLGADPGGVVVDRGLGLVSGTMDRMVDDVRLLADDTRRNREMGQAGLDYVRAVHATDVVDTALDRLVSGRDADRQGGGVR